MDKKRSNFFELSVFKLSSQDMKQFHYYIIFIINKLISFKHKDAFVFLWINEAIYSYTNYG